MATGYLVNHTHWDREWYFSAMDSLVLSDQLFTEIIEELEKHPEASFCLDGQTSILNEYLTIHPDKKERVKTLLKQKQLFTGPWYTQTDGLIPRGESMLRNLMIGVRDAKQLGEMMRIGYLPDTFGFNAQLPTILQAAGIDNTIIWRGVEFNDSLHTPYFSWKGLSDKQVITANIPQSYSAASFIEATPEYAEKRIDPIMKLHTEFGECDVVIPSGGDQLNIVSDFTKVVSDLSEYSQHDLNAYSYPEFINLLRKRNLPIYQGDFRMPKYARVHRTIGSVRSKIKKKASEVENKLLQRIEPLLVLAKQLGIEISTELLVTAWKKLLESQAHDSLGGCVTDTVAEDILHRLKEADELCDGIENTILFQIFENANLKPNEILLVNTEAKAFNGFKEIRLVVPDKKFSLSSIESATITSEVYYPERQNVLKLTPEGHKYITEPPYYILNMRIKVALPAFGYTVLVINQQSSQIYPDPQPIEQQHIENEFIKLTFENHELSFEQNGKTIKNFITLTSEGNNGDTYDFSPLEKDQPLTLSWTKAQIQLEGSTQTMILTGESSLPKNISDRSTQEQLESIPYTVKLSLDPGKKRIDGQLLFDNKVNSHRLRLKIRTDVHSELSRPQIQAGFQKKGNQEVDPNWKRNYVEKPANLFNFQRTVTHTNEQDRHLTFFGKDLYEYEVDPEHLLITLLCTTGQFGKPELAWRPGRASGDTTMMGHTMIDTPDAQEIGNYSTQFAIYTEQIWSESDIIHAYNEWATPSISYQKQVLNLFLNRLDNKLQQKNNTQKLPKYYSGLSLETDVEISSISPSLYDEDAFVIRFENNTENPQDLSKYLDSSYLSINALEEPTPSDGIIPAYDYLSVKLKYKRHHGD